jgi:ABC-type multidrug transport system ATPase subunit
MEASTFNTGSTGQRKTDTGFTITTQELSKRYNREWIFRHMNYEFSTGKTYAIIGPNGSGKSTLLQVLWGQVPPSSGTIKHAANNVEIPADDIHKHISVATPYMDLIEELTLLEHVEFHFRMKKIRAGISVNDLISIMYLDSARDKFIGNFSSGMKQRVKLALAFYSQASMLFLDEPGTNLDQNAFKWYKDELNKVSRETMIFIASNNPEEYPGSATPIDILDFKKI